MFDKFHEECGVVGVFGHPEAATVAYLSLYALQHRGQESAGIVASNGEALISHRGMGHVAEIFDQEILAPVLQGVEAQVREGGRLRMAVDADDTALLVELVEHRPGPRTLADAARQVYR